MKHLLTTLVTLFLTSAVFSQSTVYKVSKGNNSIYLGGTVHILKAEDYPLPKEFDSAFEKSETLVFETDIAAFSDPSISVKMMTQATYQDERTLQTVLDKETYEKVKKLATELKFPIDQMQKMKPSVLMITLTLVKMQTEGISGTGVDAHFFEKGKKAGKTINELETVDEQIAFITNIGEGNENEFVNKSLKDLNNVKSMMDKMIKSWKTGNPKAMENIINDMQTEFPKMYQLLLVKRNNNWMPKIENHISNDDTEFVLVGSLHLYGKDGLLEQLKAKGYEVSQL